MTTKSDHGEKGAKGQQEIHAPDSKGATGVLLLGSCENISLPEAKQQLCMRPETASLPDMAIRANQCMSLASAATRAEMGQPIFHKV